MKLDYDLIKKLLREVEQQSDGINESRVDFHGSLSPENKKYAYHIRLLISEGFLNGRIHDISTGDGRQEWLFYTGLTLAGHQALEAMENDTIWGKIKHTATSAGIEGLRQIPALALKTLTGSD